MYHVISNSPVCCMFQAVFSRSRGYLTLEVPGLSDGQPALQVGDKLTASVNSHMQPVGYDGYIHDVSIFIFTCLYL